MIANVSRDHTACVDIPALPLQALLREHAEWAEHPAVVLDRDSASGTVQWVNEAARARRIFPGMRYATALSLARDVRAGTVCPARIAEIQAALTERLWRFSPRIEPASREPGIFWLDASGLRFLYPSLEHWAACMQDDLRVYGFTSRIAVGFTRFGTYAAAKSCARTIVFDSPALEQAYVRKAPISRLPFDAPVRDTLFKLGIETLGGFIDLPPAGIRQRFGAQAYELHCLARGEGWTPLAALPIADPIERTLDLDYPESDQGRLLTIIEPLLHAMLHDCAERHEVIRALVIHLTLDNHDQLEERIAPASPTLEAAQLLLLIRLRLEARTLAAGVVALNVRAVTVARAEGQLNLLHDGPRRNTEAIQRAFAKIRAELGHDAVVCARLHEGHLPEARYAWEPLQSLSPHPSPLPEGEGAVHDDAARRPLVRRIFSPAIALPPRPRQEPDGWLVAGISEGPVEEVIGPHMVSGGWWTREIARAYYYVRTRSGRWLWIYYDQKRRRWFLQGEVE